MHKGSQTQQTHLGTRVRMYTHIILKLIHTCLVLYIPTHVPRHCSIHVCTPETCGLTPCISAPTLTCPHTPTQVCTLGVPTLACLKLANMDGKGKALLRPAGDRQ